MDGSNLNLSDMGAMNNGQGGMGGGKPDRTAPTGEEAAAASAQPGEMGEAPTGGGGGQMPSSGSFSGNAVAASSDETGWIWIAASAAILLLGLAVAFKFRR